MTSYNIAVTTGHTIFRPKVIKPEDIFNNSIYYDTMVKMIEYFDVIFEDKQIIDH